MKRLLAAALAAALLSGCGSVLRDDRWKALFRDIPTASEALIICSKAPWAEEIGLILGVIQEVDGVELNLGRDCDSAVEVAISAYAPFYGAALKLEAGDRAEVVLEPAPLEPEHLGLTETRRAKLPPRRALSLRRR